MSHFMARATGHHPTLALRITEASNWLMLICHYQDLLFDVSLCFACLHDTGICLVQGMDRAI